MQTKDSSNQQWVVRSQSGKSRTNQSISLDRQPSGQGRKHSRDLQLEGPRNKKAPKAPRTTSKKGWKCGYYISGRLQSPGNVMSYPGVRGRDLVYVYLSYVDQSVEYYRVSALPSYAECCIQSSWRFDFDGCIACISLLYVRLSGTHRIVLKRRNESSGKSILYTTFLYQIFRLNSNRIIPSRVNQISIFLGL